MSTRQNREDSITIIQLKAKPGQRCANCIREFRVGERIKFVAYGIVRAVFICDKGPTCERRLLRNAICSWAGPMKQGIESHETEMSLEDKS